MSIEAEKMFDKGSRFFEEQLKAETFKQRIRRDARRIIEEDDRVALAAEGQVAPKLVYDPLPAESPELIPGILPEAGTAAIVGETDTGKSLIACEIGSSLLTGEPLWGAIRPTRRIDKVVYVLGEHSCATLQGLFHRTRLPHEGKFLLLGPEQLHPHKALVIGGQQQLIAIDRMCRWAEGAGLIVFDPIAGFVQGNNAENDNATMRTLIDSMGLIAAKVGAACLVLAHAGKPKVDDTGAEVRRTSYFTRGASAVEDALVSVYYLRKRTLVKQQGSQEKYELLLRKFKGNPSSESFILDRDPITKRNTLAVTKNMKASYPNLEEKIALNLELQRLIQSKPKYSEDTCFELMAAIHDVPVDTLKRWLTSI